MKQNIKRMYANLNNSSKKQINKIKSIIEPSDLTDLNQINICLYDSRSIQKMVDICLPHANSSEFQIHYHSLQVHLKKKDKKGTVVITIPLAYYNFKQKVDTSSVEMEMKDVNESSKISLEFTKEKMNELFNKMPLLNNLHLLDYEVNFTMSDNGSIHRHPSDFSFSSIDKDKNPEEPGVIYRQANAKDLYQTDSVIYLGNKNPKFVCTETRIVNVKKLKDDDGIVGTYTEIPTISFIHDRKEKNIIDIREILGLEKKEENLLDNFLKTRSLGISIEEYPLLVEILKSYIESEYEPNIENVIGNRIKDNKTTYTKNYYNYNNNNLKYNDTEIITIDGKSFYWDEEVYDFKSIKDIK